MVELKGTKADNIANALKDILVRLQLPLADCRGQCHDGASVMARVLSLGLQCKSRRYHAEL